VDLNVSHLTEEDLAWPDIQKVSDVAVKEILSKNKE
jgi:hypothetical protein